MSYPSYGVPLGTQGSPDNAPGTEAQSQNVLFPRPRISPGDVTTYSVVFEVADKPILLRAFGFGLNTVARLQMVYGQGAALRVEDFRFQGASFNLTQKANVLPVGVEGRYRLALSGADPLAVTVMVTPAGLGFGGADALPLASTFTSPTPGSVTRSLDSKLGEMISVLDKGLTVNGVTDNRAAFQAVISDIPAGQAREIIVPPGSYVISSATTNAGVPLPFFKFQPGASVVGGIQGKFAYPVCTEFYRGQTQIIQSAYPGPDVTSQAVARFDEITNYGGLNKQGYGRRLVYYSNTYGGAAFDIADGRLAVWDRTNGQAGGVGLTDWVVAISPAITNAGTVSHTYAAEWNVTNRAGAPSGPYATRLAALLADNHVEYCGITVIEGNLFGNPGTSYDGFAFHVFSPSEGNKTDGTGKPAKAWSGLLFEPMAIMGGGYCIQASGNTNAGIPSDDPAAFLRLNSRWAVAFDTSNATLSGPVLRAANNKAIISARNAANSADVEALRVNAFDQVVVGGQQVIPWTAYTPTVTGDAAPFTTTTLISARYNRFGNVVRGIVVFQLVTVGAGAVAIRCTLPFTAAAFRGKAAGVNVSSGQGLIGTVGAGAAFARVTRYDAASPIFAGDFYQVEFEYEAVT